LQKVQGLPEALGVNVDLRRPALPLDRYSRILLLGSIGGGDSDQKRRRWRPFVVDYLIVSRWRGHQHDHALLGLLLLLLFAAVVAH
jgi:hypothetical protein